MVLRHRVKIKMENKTRLQLSDEVINFKVKNDLVLSEDYMKLLELKNTIDVLIKNHLEEIKERTQENPVIGNYEVVEEKGKNMFNKELANAWLESNGLVERFSVTKAAYTIPAVEVPAETSVDFKTLQTDLKKRFKADDEYINRFTIAKVKGIKLELIK